MVKYLLINNQDLWDVFASYSFFFTVCKLIVSQTLFKGKKYLVNHMKKSHGNDAFETDKLIERTCTQCQKEFTNKSVLARHIKTVHEQERPFKCDHCLKHFFNNNQLQVKSLYHVIMSPALSYLYILRVSSSQNENLLSSSLPKSQPDS